MSQGWKNLSFRLPAFILLASLVPLGAFGLFAINHSQNVLLETQGRATRRIAILEADLVEQRLGEILQNMQTDAENLDLLKLSPEDREWALLTMMRQHGALKELTLIDATGQEQVRVAVNHVFLPGELSNQADNPAFRAAMSGKTYIGEPELHEQEHANIGYLSHLSVPLFSPDRQAVAAVLLADVVLRDSLAMVIDITIGQRGTVYVVDAGGRIIAHADSSLVLGEAALPLADLLSGTAAGDDVPVRLFSNASGVAVQGSLAPIRGTGWYVVGERPMHDILSELEPSKQALQLSLAGLLLLLFPIVYFFYRRTVVPLQQLERGTEAVGAGRFDVIIPVASEDEVGRVSRSFNLMARNLQRMTEDAEQVSWHLKGLADLDAELRGSPSVEELSRKAVSLLAQYVAAPVAALYVNDGKDVYCLAGGYAYQPGAGKLREFALGQGLVGQVACERRTLELNDVPADYLRVTSGLGESASQSLLLVPLIHDDAVLGVIELGAFVPFSPLAKSFLEHAAGPLAIAINAAKTLKALDLELEKSQRFSEELQAANEELEEQAQRLRASEEELQAQQEELQVANEELEEKTLFLQQQKDLIVEKNQTLELARASLEEHARELQATSKYKSEFLANMSHELRTPLNSLLILSQDLASNREGNLLAGQIESAEVIYQSGSDLLRLINEILDLSKIEAGKMELHLDELDLKAFRVRLERSFQHMAQARNLDFAVTLEADAPAALQTDPQRLEQILKNLVANALKFTSLGSVQIRIGLPLSGVLLQRPGLEVSQCLALAVIDTGTGIAQDKLEEIFSAFQQGDGSISRQYGGTGLGLTISRELAGLLGGELQVESQLEIGSTFTLYLPLACPAASSEPAWTASDPVTAVSPQPAPNPAPQSAREERPLAPSIADDRAQMAAGERVILIVEDDLKFVRILADLCHDKGFRFLHAGDGETGLQLAQDYQPAAILLDIRLPGMHGLELLERLKNSTSLRHIPVHMISVEDRSHAALQRGAIGFLSKPSSREQLDQAFEHIEEVLSGRLRKLLVVEDNAAQRKSIVALIGNGDVVSVEAETGQQALELLRQGDIDCMILDLTLPDMTGFELLKQFESLEGFALPPVIIYTGRDLSREEEAALREYAASIIIKGVCSPERLLDEASLFLHRVVGKLPVHKQQMIAALHAGETQFDGRKILLVDDDMRNVFALSRVLESLGVKVIKSTNGEKALTALEEQPDIDLVLIDIMMPVMDGYEAMRRIREQARFVKLPILALTAKAMPEDRGKCIEAGANDYLTKPVDVPKLLSLLRVWLYR